MKLKPEKNSGLNGIYFIYSFAVLVHVYALYVFLRGRWGTGQNESQKEIYFRWL